MAATAIYYIDPPNPDNNECECIAYDPSHRDATPSG